jgi:hypothetical protein
MLPMLVASAPAWADRSAQDIAAARKLYNDGEALRDKGDLKGALEKFKAAHALGNTPITGLELCKTHQALHQPVEAREACLSVGRIQPLSEESQRSKDSRVEAAKIASVEEPKMGSIKVKVTGAPDGATLIVSIDGVTIPQAALTEPRPVDPGPHVILASVSGGQQTKASLDTKEGENREVEVPVRPPAPGTPTNPPPPIDNNGNPQPKPEEHKGSSFPYVMYTIGGVGALIGIVGGGIALSKAGTLSDKCTQKICGRDEWNDLDTGKTWGTVSTVSFILGGVALGIGLIGQVATSSHTGSSTPPKKSRIGFTFRGLDGTF